MKSLLNVCLYSGMSHLDPQVNLSDEDTQKLRDKVFALTEKPERDPWSRLGNANQISVSFESGDERLVAILSYPAYLEYPPAVGVYWNSNELPEYFKDTENINEFLCTLAAPAIEQHYESMKDMWVKTCLEFPNKKRYNTQQDAETAILMINKPKLHVYQCGTCRGWHLTSK